MLENGMDERFAEISRAESYKEAIPRAVNIDYDKGPDAGDWRPPSHDELAPAGKNFWAKCIGVAIIATVVIIGLVALGM